MQEKYKAMLNKITKNPKLLIIVAVAGILIIGFSSVFENSENKTEIDESAFNIDNYVQSIEADLENSISLMLGSDDVSVLITLDSSVERVFADEIKRNSENEIDPDRTQNKDSNENNYVLYKDDKGQEIPLTVTEIMPSIKGVLVVCYKGHDEAVQNMVKQAVTTALDVSYTRVCVTGFSKF